MMRCCLMAGCLAACLLAQQPEPRWRVLNHDARLAVEARDYARLRTTLLELSPLMPGNPRIAYNLAASEAKLGNPRAAIEGVRNLAAMGLIYDLKADDDFASIKDLPEFAAVLKQMEANKKPVTHAAPAFALAEDDLLPEDITYDPKTKRFFVSSVRKSKIITGDGKEFARADWSVLALAVDEKRRILWAATAWIPHCERCDPRDKDKTALLAFDLDSGALKKRVESPVPGLLGDMTISGKGDIYVSEGIHGAVLTLKAGGNVLERLDSPGDFPSPQTPALAAGERTLYVPDYVRGIAAIDLETRQVKWLKPSPGIATAGIDGLYGYRDSFIAVQNGTTPNRIVRFSLDLSKQEVLEANWPGLGEPTHGTIVGDELYFIANAGWSAYDEQGKKKPGHGPVRSSIQKLRLSPALR